MYITTLTSPFILRRYLDEDETLNELTNGQIFPINAEVGTEGDFITFTATGYRKEYQSAVNYDEIRTVEVELCSKDYDRCVFDLLDALRKVFIRMRNDGIDITEQDADEYKYAFKEGGETWNVERVTVEMKNVNLPLTPSQGGE